MAGTGWSLSQIQVVTESAHHWKSLYGKKNPEQVLSVTMLLMFRFDGGDLHLKAWCYLLEVSEEQSSL